MKSSKNHVFSQEVSTRRIVMRPGLGVKVVNHAKVLQMQPSHLIGVKRGEISGFSRASAARLRDRLFEFDYSGGNCFGMALTAPPWSPVAPEDAWASMSRHIKRVPSLVGLVWRKEVTRKGLPHYHLAVWSDCWPQTFVGLAQLWARCLIPKGVGVCPARVRLSGSRVRLPSGRCSPVDVASLCRGSCLSVTLSPRNQRLLSSTKALQYLCDHTSKHKAYQALTTGRAWGVVGKPPTVDLGDGLDLLALPPRVLHRVHDALRRMGRYWYPCESSMFGYRWSHGRNFARRGSHVLFRSSAPESLLRMVRWYLDKSGED